LGDNVRKNKKGRAAACMGEKANSYRNLMGKSEEKGNLGRPIRTGEENIKLNLKQRTV
jgi:hypothetical protein